MGTWLTSCSDLGVWMKPLDSIKLSDDPLVMTYLVHITSHKQPDCWTGEKLSKDQLVEVDDIVDRIHKADAETTGHQKVEFLERNLTIISGHFCGATTHAADLLTRLGVPCSHEVIMREGGLFPGLSYIGGTRAECSGDSARWVNVLEKALLVHLIRDPLKTANSFFRLRNPNYPDSYGERKGDSGITVDDIVGCVLNFHKCVEARKPDVVWRIERHNDILPVLQLFDVDPPLGRLDHMRKQAKKNEHRKGQEDVIKWDGLPRSLQRFAEKWGYGPTGKEIFENDKESW